MKPIGYATHNLRVRTVGHVEASELIEQRRLARTRFAHDSDKLALVYLERHTAQRMHRLVAHEEVALHVVEFYYYFLFVHSS